MALLTLVLAVAVLFLGAALWFLRQRLREASDSIRERHFWLRESHGRGLRWMGVETLQDLINQLVSEHREWSEAERGYLEQIHATLGSLREAVFIVDSENVVVMGNEALKELLSLRENPVGRRLESIIQGPQFFDYVQGIRAGQAAGFFVLEVTVGRQTRWFEVTGSRLPERKEEKGLLALFVLHDITKQTRLERVRTEFVANLSHELRTPVTIIKGFADTLIEDHDSLPSEERAYFLEKIQKNVGRLNQMLEELLTLSRLETNPGALQFELVSLHKIIAETVEPFRHRLAANQSLELALADGNDTLMLDPMRVAQVIENLLENALRHAKGFTRLVISTEVKAGGVACRVTDNGQGIPNKDLPHLFERFYRVDKGRSRESGGTGLGLSIVKHIVQQHGGSVAAESRLGEGASMVFEIPYPEVLAEKAVMNFGPSDDAASRAIMSAREFV